MKKFLPLLLVVFMGLSPADKRAWMRPCENQLTYSEDISNAAWTKTGATANSATLVTITAQYGGINETKTITAGKSYVFVATVKKVSGTYTLLAMEVGGNLDFYMPISTSYQTFRIGFVATATGGQYVGIKDYDAAGWGQIYVSQIQFYEVPASSKYIKTTSAAVLKSARNFCS